MMILDLILTLTLPWLLGLALLTTGLRQKLRFFGFWEKLALAFSLGWGGQTILMFFLNLSKIPLTFNHVLLADLGLLSCLLPFSYHAIFTLTKIKLPRLVLNWSGLVFSLIGVKVAVTLWSAYIKPVFDPDIIQTYALAAKMIYLNKVIPQGAPISDKPLLPFLSQAWSVLGIHPWNDTLLTLSHPFLFLSLLIIFYAALARHFQRWYALLFTFLLSSIPFLVFHVGTAYTDWPQAFYYSLATIYLYLFLKEFPRAKAPAAGYLLLSALLLGLAVWAKKSGLYYAGINLTTVTAFLIINRARIDRQDWKIFAQAALVFTLVVTPWLVYHQFVTLKEFSAQTVQALPSVFTQTELRSGLPIIQALFRNAFLEDNWHLLGTLLAAVLLLYPKRAWREPLLLIILLQLAGIFIIFRFTNMYRYIFDDTLLNRLTLHFVPVILFFCAEVIGDGENLSGDKTGPPS